MFGGQFPLSLWSHGKKKTTTTPAYLHALTTEFNVDEAFTIHQDCFGWTVDPTQRNRVWVWCRQSAAHDKKEFMSVPPTGKQLVFPPQCYITWILTAKVNLAECGSHGRGYPSRQYRWPHWFLWILIWCRQTHTISQRANDETVLEFAIH